MEHSPNIHRTKHKKSQAAEKRNDAEVREAVNKAKKIIDEVNNESSAQQEEIDAYVDSRLATLEVILNKTLDTITKGRARLAGVDAKSALTELNDKK
mgnify:CR=1 FL=1